jgi:hypothetical protein
MRDHLLKLLVFLAILPACQTTTLPDTGFPGAALVTGTTDNGLYSVELRTAPSQPPPRSGGRMDILVKDTKGNEVDGLTLEVVPWMPAMNHGVSTNPTVTPQGHGHYLAEPLELSMAGTWQLRIKLVKGAEESHVAPSLDVP